VAVQLTLDVDTAAALMRPGPPAIADDADVREALALLTDAGVGAVAVVNRTGQPVGVLSRDDLLVHEREKAGSPAAGPPAQVRDLMTPAVFSVRPETPAGRVIEELVAMHVHQLFVVSPDGKLLGSIHALDVLRRLRA
jgi:CBS domain-containing protein